MQVGKRLLLSVSIGSLIAGGVMAEDPPAPPPLPPIADPAHPTTQSGDPAALFDFVPETVVKFGNGDEIKRTEVVSVMLPALKMALESGRTPDQAQLTDAVNRRIEELVNRRVLAKLCSDAGLKPDVAAAEKEFAEQEKQAGAEQVAMYLQMQGLDRKEFVAQLSERRVIDRWIDEAVLPGITVADAEVEAFFKDNQAQFAKQESVRASHVLVKVEDPAQKEAARAKIDGILKKVRDGGDFAEIAKAESDCPSSARGGDLGAFGRGRMVKPFEEAAFAMAPGDVSDVVETQFGFHVIKVTEHEKAGSAELNAEVRATIVDQLRGRQVTDIVSKKIEETRKSEGVKILFPEKG